MNDLGGQSISPESEPSKDDKTMAMVAHLSQLTYLVGIPGFIGPLVVWLMKKDQSPFIAQNAMHALFFQIGIFVLAVIVGILAIVTCGFGALLGLPLLVIMVLYPIIGGLRANEGKIYSYPVTGKFVK